MHHIEPATTQEFLLKAITYLLKGVEEGSVGDNLLKINVYKQWQGLSAITSRQPATTSGSWVNLRWNVVSLAV